MPSVPRNAAPRPPGQAPLADCRETGHRRPHVGRRLTRPALADTNLSPLGKGDVQGGPGCVQLPDGYEQPLSYFDPILWIGSVTVEGIFPVDRVLPGTGTSQPGENNEPGNAEGYHGG
jgi:hypothetical protein